ncbi:hypothetical protein VCR4J2_500109 [Vibrio coralliirubri]|uniref:rhamnosyltransferase WsaF family glycosyltransferase n=1 Tax=Vibrio coralliirubri TaxID=1516159 RepID=UPI00062ECC75|nr:glycosyltransferase [Vibrio coralliirubri]CDT39212.1 hypothetical protein VCR4J2_500109 [Vibrio coralliirubri]
MVKEFIRRTLEQRSIKKVRRSGLIDSQWYLNHYEDLTGTDVDAVEHYYLFGWKEGRNPNEFFDTKWFMDKYNLKNQFPLDFYLNNWGKGNVDPCPEFNVTKYISNNSDVLSANVDPLYHYLHFGRLEGRQRYSDNEDTNTSEYQHYSDTGLFLSHWYSTIYEDLRDSGINALEHYVLFGELEGRNPNPYFDTKWYRKKYAEFLANGISPLLFYASEGWKLGHSPSPSFDAPRYIEEYLRDIDDEIEPLAHFLLKGKKDGETPKSLDELKVSTGGRLKFDREAKLTQDPPMRALIDNLPVSLNPSSIQFSNNLDIHWVMPDFAPGAGGHMTIFRTIRFLETFGHKNTIWVYAPTLHMTEDEAYQDIVQHFQLVKAQVNFTSDPAFSEASGDVIFATDWGSVSFVNSVRDFKRRFYFVQDHEPEFYAQGSYAIAAKGTYKHDLDCICASPWLKELMETKYNRWAREFWLSVDFDTYQLPIVDRSNSDVVKIAFYARHFTSRRAVELGFLALEALAERGLNIEVHCFGAPLPFDATPFKCIDHGICNTKQLAEIYQECDIGVVFSATNYSLIPQEMMACGIPVAELDVESTRAIFPDGVVTYLSTEPRLMADGLARLVENKSERVKQAQIAYDWVSQFTWEDAARAVESAIFERLPQLGFERRDLPKSEQIKASVIIPTWNAGEVFHKVIRALQAQKAPWAYEVIVVDSGSSDGTVEFLKGNSDIKLYEIPNSEFQHGRTRNFAISKTQGELVAVLTQDALPVDEYWLYNMVTSLEHYPEAAGVFGKHYAWPDADSYTKRDLINHFEGFEKHPYCVSKFTDEAKWNSGDLGWRQFLHFYSDNNSMMRKKVWEELPYPEVKFGEDQAWALAIIEAGYQKVYSKQGAVYHSHDFDEGDVGKRAFEEAQFFKENFGYTMVDPSEYKNIIRSLNEIDEKWGIEIGLSSDMINRRKESNRAKIMGFNKVN